LLHEKSRLATPSSFLVGQKKKVKQWGSYLYRAQLCEQHGRVKLWCLESRLGCQVTVLCWSWLLLSNSEESHGHHVCRDGSSCAESVEGSVSKYLEGKGGCFVVVDDLVLEATDAGDD